jgi:eukaryotic-like serine/threonine-protein kinase
MSITCLTCLEENPDGTAVCISCGSELAIDDDNSGASSSSSPLHLQPGALLQQGRYKIDKTLGQGGFGITYKSTDQTTGAIVAVKEFFPDRSARIGTVMHWSNAIAPAEQRKELEKFRAEAENLSKCQHPNIVKVYDWFEENQTAYIVMEFITGKPLSDILKQEGRLSEDRIRTYLQQIAEALKVVHAQQLLHRDLKPDNIILNANDQAILIDFGNARAFMANLTHKLTNTGTPAYAPPEQTTSRGRFSPSLDFYSLCATLYELITGIEPLSALERLSSDTLKSPRQVAPHLSPLIDQIILTGLKLRAEERFQTADEILDALSGKLISPLMRKAREFVTQGKLSDAAQTYEKCVTQEPGNGEAAVEQALVLIHIAPHQAIAAAQRAIQTKPNDGRGHGVLGLLECRKSNWTTAVKHLQQAAHLAPQEAWIQTNLAWALAKTGDWQTADSTIAQALQLHPTPFALGLQSWIAVNQQNYKPAIRSARQALFQAKQTPTQNTQELLGWVYPCLAIALDKAIVTQQSNDVERCLQEYQTQLPDSGFALGFQGWKYAAQGQWQEAVNRWQLASQKRNSPVWILPNLGIAQENLQDLQSAIKTYELQIQKFPNDATALQRLGTVCGCQGQWEPAKNYLSKAVQVQPDYAEAFHNLGWVLLNLKQQNGQTINSREILSAYRKALELYSQQSKTTLAQSLTSAFRAIGVEL